MSDALPLPIAQALERSDRSAYFEQRIFVLSPFGMLTTTLLVFILLMGAFALTTQIDRRTFVSFHAALPDSTRVATILSLLVAAVLGMQRYTLIKERQDVMSLVAILEDGEAHIDRICELTPQGTRLGIATMVGLLGGLFVGLFVIPHSAADHRTATFYWFLAVITMLVMLFARGVELTRTGGRNYRDMLEHGLKIDLLRSEPLSVIGRSAARLAIVWFAASAITCLLFIGDGLSIFSVVLVLSCAAMGLWIFVRTMEQVHRKIRAAKAAELDRLRVQIDRLRHEAHTSADAAQCLQGLLAYEARIATTPEWPFDQSTAVRVGASALILTVPWFGQALASDVIEQVGHVLH